MTDLELARERWENARDILVEVGKELPMDRPPRTLPISEAAVTRFADWRKLAASRKPRSRRA